MTSRFDRVICGREFALIGGNSPLEQLIQRTADLDVWRVPPDFRARPPPSHVICVQAVREACQRLSKLAGVSPGSHRDARRCFSLGDGS